MESSNIINQPQDNNSSQLTAYNVDGLELFFDNNRKVRASQSAIARMCGCSEWTIREDLKTLEENGVILDVIEAQVQSRSRLVRSRLHTSVTIHVLLKKRNPARLEQFSVIGIDEGLAIMAGVPNQTTQQPKAIVFPDWVPTDKLGWMRMAIQSEENNQLLLEKVELLEDNILDLTEKIEEDSEHTSLGKFILDKRDDLIDMEEMAQKLGINGTRLFVELKFLRILKKNGTTPYQHLADAGYFKVTQKHTTSYQQVLVTLITPKGEVWLTKKHEEMMTHMAPKLEEWLARREVEAGFNTY